MRNARLRSDSLLYRPSLILLGIERRRNVNLQRIKFQLAINQGTLPRKPNLLLDRISFNFEAVLILTRISQMNFTNQSAWI
jgi:hypothetical protein